MGTNSGPGRQIFRWVAAKTRAVVDGWAAQELDAQYLEEKLDETKKTSPVRIGTWPLAFFSSIDIDHSLLRRV